MRTKRMPLFLMACFALFLGLATQSCVDEYDDSALTGRVDDLENRVESLEKLCQQLNSNIEAVRTLAEAAQNNVSITSITPLTENGVEVGYVIEFTQGDPITIYHGQDGFTPVIGVKMDTNGIYYWTLNGEWLTDEAGNKVKAVGTDGKDGQDGTPGAPGQDGEDGKDGEDGITPQLKIENGRWLLSMDNGKTWQDLGPATGADGQDGKDGEDGEDGKDGTDGDSFFKSVDYTSSPDYVLFTLADGTTLKIPTWYAFDNLRALCDQFNKDIQALQAIVEALQAKDEVTSVEPLLENGDEVGYTIYFEKHSPINIYHGKNGQDGQDGTDGTDGKDGVSPMIGVRQDTDGIYYWTLNGEWLTDETGNKIKAQGTDGADGTDGTDGATPRLKIGEDGYWYISYSGNDDDWTQLGKATGENGQDGQPGQDGQDGQDGDSFFKSLTEDEDYVYLTLASDGSTIAVPKHKPMSISFSETEDIRVLPSQTYPIQYTITGATDKTVIKALAQDGFRAEVKPTDTSTGTIEITTPSTILSSEVLVFVTDGEERTIMRSINFVEGVINITNRSYTVAYMGGRVDVELSTNIDYTVEIPAEDQSWISLVPASRVVMRDETVSFMIAQNNSTQLRYSIIKLVDKLGVTSETIQISQRGGSSQDLHVETAGSLEQLISKEDAQIIEELKLTGHLNTFDYEFLKTMPNLKTVDLSDLDDETIPASAFSGSKVTTVLLPLNLKTISSRAFFQSAITSVYIPETVESIGDNAFQQSAITSVYISESVKSIGTYAFAVTASLTGNVTIPGSVATIGSYAFYQSTFSSLTLNEGIETIGERAFYQCTEATGDLVIPNSVTEMGTYAFAESTFTGSLTIGNGLSIIPESAFRQTLFTGNITIGENVKEIGDYAFYKCSGFTGNLVIPDKVETIGDKAFYECTGFKGYLSIGSNVKNIGSGAFVYQEKVSSIGYTYALNFSKVYCKAPTPPELTTTKGNSYYSSHDSFGEYGLNTNRKYYPTHLLVPIGLSQTYRQSDWEYFTIIEEVEF